MRSVRTMGAGQPYAMRRGLIATESGIAMLLAGSAAAALAAAGPSGSSEAVARPETHTAQGIVRGQVNNGVAAFRAIPYAAPPTGPLRFRAAAPAPSWAGVRDAANDGPSCPQNPSADPAGKPSVTEDCLFLNVFTPSAGPAAKRPVMVWIHGGGWNEGFAGARQYDPTPLVKEGNVVVVTIAYRLGTLGLLAAKSLDEPVGVPSGDELISDAQAALRWVRTNIRAFGGDPANVTIVGESAGANSVLALVASPRSKGLFQKAIAQSATENVHTLAREEAEKSGADIAQALGCGPGPEQADCLRHVPVETILKTRSRFGLVEHPEMFPVDPYAGFRDGKFNHVPMLIGSNINEGHFFAAGAERTLGHRMSEAEYVTQMRSNFGPKADAMMKLYPAAAAPSPTAALGDAITDRRFACYAELARAGAAKYGPVYGYEMNEPDPAQQQPRLKISLANTAYHTSDLAYLFDYATAGPLSGDAARLGKRMRAYWIQFAKTGSPNGNGLPAWPRYTPARRGLLNMSNSGGITMDFAARHRCPVLEQAGLVSSGG